MDDYDYDLEFDMDLELDYDLEDFCMDNETDGLDTRIYTPKIYKKTLTQKIKYSNAEKLADEIDLSENSRVFVIVSGNFIFGDFIEALINNRQLTPKNIYISSLGLSENNIDSLKNILYILHSKGDRLERMNIILSNYFYSHEKYNLVPYLYKELDVNNKLQVAFCSTHCKIALIETYGGKYYVMHGSANMRSSANIEQFVIEENEDLYNFNQSYMDNIIDKYKTVNHAIIGGKLWQAVQEAESGKAQKPGKGERVQQNKDGAE